MRIDSKFKQKLVRRGSGYLVYIPVGVVPENAEFYRRFLFRNNKVLIEFK